MARTINIFMMIMSTLY